MELVTKEVTSVGRTIEVANVAASVIELIRGCEVKVSADIEENSTVVVQQEQRGMPMDEVVQTDDPCQIANLVDSNEEVVMFCSWVRFS